MIALPLKALQGQNIGPSPQHKPKQLSQPGDLHYQLVEGIGWVFVGRRSPTGGTHTLELLHLTQFFRMEQGEAGTSSSCSYDGLTFHGVGTLDLVTCIYLPHQRIP
jgi:hypothetical protein